MHDLTAAARFPAAPVTLETLDLLLPTLDSKAVEKFDEVLQIDARDAQAARAKEIGKRYHGRPRDAGFETFSNALPLRALDRR